MEEAQMIAMSRVVGALAAVILALALPAQAGAEEEWLATLITETPAEGFDLAVSMARQGVKTTQPDVDVLFTLRPGYAHDPDSLINASGVIAAYFATVAEANDYWRD
jgi:hypothetical protein